jgi:hypothetical protein
MNGIGNYSGAFDVRDGSANGTPVAGVYPIENFTTGTANNASGTHIWIDSAFNRNTDTTAHATEVSFDKFAPQDKAYNLSASKQP